MMKSVAGSFIRDWASKTSEIGIVDFDSRGKILNYLTSIEMEDARTQMVDSLNGIIASGATNIQDGILKGIEVILHYDPYL